MTTKSNAATRDFKITKAGANHTVVDADGGRRLVGYGDTITLKEYDANSKTNDLDADGNPLLGKFNNLGLVSVNRHNVDTADNRLTDDDEFEDHEVPNPKGPVKSPQGTQSGHSDPAANDGTEQTTTDDGGAADEDNTGISAEDLKDLIDEVEDSKVGDGTFEAARDRVLKADLFEAETLPTTKAGVLQALLELQNAE